MPLPEFTAVYRLALDPKLQVMTKAGGEKNVPLLWMRLAASSSRLDPITGIWEKSSRLFLDAELFGLNAAELYPLLFKGSMVTVTGELCTDEWRDRNGEKRSKTKIKARRVYPFTLTPAES